MIRKFVPFAFGGVLLALVLNAVVPRRMDSEHRDAASSRAPVAAIAPDDESKSAGIPDPWNRSAEWRERHRLVPKAALEQKTVRMDFERAHGREVRGPSKAPRR